ncbi:MAG: hypothetical protein KGL53_04645 [Elusimicrobia bacterium]|nr:hypothetical protein [Elusimicrobiota bacterium]
MNIARLLLCSWLASASAAPAPAPGKPGPNATAVAVSTAAAQPDVDDIYGGASFRDPFQPLAGAGVAPAAAAPAAAYKPEDFSIHTLQLRGILRDSGGPMALLVDSRNHLSFVLRGRRLYDPRHKPVPGVTGSVRPDHKSVRLMTADKDVQDLRLGGDSDAAEE